MSTAAILRMPSLESCGRQLRGELASTPHPVQVDRSSNWVLEDPLEPRNSAGRLVLSVLGVAERTAPCKGMSHVVRARRHNFYRQRPTFAVKTRLLDA